jgi:hypothetical protein
VRRWARPDLADRQVRGREVARSLAEERGSQTVEWVGIAAVVVALVAGIIGFVPEVGDAVAEALSALIDQVVAGG